MVLAVAVLINDIDVIGANGGNAGFKICEHQHGIFAQTINIDPGSAFNMYSDSDERMIRVALTGIPKETELKFNELPMGTKKEFANTLHRISETTEATFKGFFTRDGAQEFVTYYDLTVDRLTKFLMDRRAAMMSEYRELLDGYSNPQEVAQRKKSSF